MLMDKVNLFWFRRDLRLDDNHGLYRALTEAGNVQPIFIFDTDILDRLEDKKDRRVQFIHNELGNLQKSLEARGSSLQVYIGRPIEVFASISNELSIAAVYANHDHEPYGVARDKAVAGILQTKGIRLRTFKDHSIFERDEVLKDDGTPYTVYTPYSRKWKARLENESISRFPSEEHLENLQSSNGTALPSLEEIGFEKTSLLVPPREVSLDMLAGYAVARDIPAIRGTSRVSVHLRFGTVSIREQVKLALKHSEKWLNELIWRDFYMMILWHFPHAADRAFKPKYDNVEWRIDEEGFQKWCTGKTGFPIVDAGMRELNATGFMHNRVRMISASFLSKDLLIDWRWGEAYFAQKLLDFELSSNNGGWQWASGSGCDSAPYFRVFNPELQTKKFDPNLDYIKMWVPELNTLDYPAPIVDHKVARDRALIAYKNALQ